MPKLISQKNLRRPPSSGYVLSSSVAGVRSWVDNKSIDVTANGTSVGTASTVDFSSSSVTGSAAAGIATVTIAGADEAVYSIIAL